MITEDPTYDSNKFGENCELEERDCSIEIDVLRYYLSEKLILGDSSVTFLNILKTVLTISKKHTD